MTKLISRGTSVFLLIALVSAAVLIYRVHQFQRSCREYERAHEAHAAVSIPTQESSGQTWVDFDPCAYQDPMPIPDSILAFIFMGSLLLFIRRLIGDIFARVGRKRMKSSL
jgi:hypothetical protein